MTSQLVERFLSYGSVFEIQSANSAVAYVISIAACDPGRDMSCAATIGAEFGGTIYARGYGAQIRIHQSDEFGCRLAGALGGGVNL